MHVCLTGRRQKWEDLQQLRLAGLYQCVLSASGTAAYPDTMASRCLASPSRFRVPQQQALTRRDFANEGDWEEYQASGMAPRQLEGKAKVVRRGGRAGQGGSRRCCQCVLGLCVECHCSCRLDVYLLALAAGCATCLFMPHACTGRR